MIVDFHTYRISNATEKYVKNYICKHWNIQEFQINIKENKILLTDKTGNIFAEIAEIIED